MTELDFALLPCLEAILREGSVTGAARRLGRSQPAISRELARLRSQIGDPIIVRTNAGMQLTPRAEVIAIQMQEAMAALRGLATDEAVFDPSRASATFRVSIGDYEAALLVPHVLAHLEAEAPKVCLSIIHRRRPDVERSLNLGEVDLAVGRFVRPGNLLFQAHLFSDGFSVCASIDHPQREQLHDMPTLLRQRFVLIAPGGTGELWGLFDDALARTGHAREVVLSLPHFLLLPDLLMSGEHVAIVPTLLARHLARSHTLAVLPSPVPQPGFDIDMLWHQRTDRHAGSQWLRRRFADAARKLSGPAARE